MQPPIPPTPPGVGGGVRPPTVPAVPQPQPSGKARSASVLPLVLAFIAMAASVYLVYLNGGIWVSIGGYILTPIIVSVCLGWDNLSQRRGLQDVWFSPKPDFSTFLRLFVVISFLIAIPHIHEISAFIAERLTAGHK